MADDESDTALSRLHARIQAVDQALVALTSAHEAGIRNVSGLEYDRLMRAYQFERDQLEDELRSLRDEQGADLPAQTDHEQADDTQNGQATES